jgi:hypothetical protein
MELSLITSENEWEALQPKWDTLQASSFRHYPFLEFWYLHNWWQNLGGGEWNQDNATLQNNHCPGRWQIGWHRPAFLLSRVRIGASFAFYWAN